LIVTAGIGPAASLSGSVIHFDAFISEHVQSSAGEKILKDIAPGVDFAALPAEERASLATEVFYRILRDTGRDFNDPKSDGYRNYDTGLEAIKSLFPEDVSWEGSILSQNRDIRTRSGGDIHILAPGGGLSMADFTIGNPFAPPGIISESGGQVSIFTRDSVSIGTGRIFTLRGGDVLIWSSKGDIAAGSSSRTIQSAPPTRVVIDPQSASVETDLAGLATGGGIGVLATVAGVDPGDVDLIAPSGIIDAGDAGIRVSGNINLAAVTVVNAGNISAGGVSTGAPSASVSAPSIGAVTSAANAAAATGSTEANPAEEQARRDTPTEQEESLSVITVEVIGYGGGAAPEDEDDEQEDRDDDETDSGPGAADFENPEF
jgi:filamentous hemagglutinin